MPNLVCETCGSSFFQATGRPAKRCPDHREQRRYGNAHQKLRAATVGLAVGKPCVRCRELIREGDAVDLDHADDGSGYLPGLYSHRHCNRSAGTVALNKARSEAYRQVKGLQLPAVTAGSSSNGSSSGDMTATTVQVREPEAPRCQRTAAQIDASAAARDPLPCICARRNSRCW